MATRSTIAMKTETGVAGVYCHFDGYVTNNGQILHDFYDSTEKVAELLKKGDMSSLGETIESCCYYVDRGEDPEDLKPRLGFSWKSFLLDNAEAFNYFWDGEKWMVAWEQRVNLLSEVLNSEEEE